MIEFPRLDSADVIGLDIETCDPELKERGNGACRDDTFIAGLAVATRDAKWYFPMRHEVGENIDPEKVKAWANDQLSTDIPKVGANLAYDFTHLTMEGFEIGGELRDIQVAEPLIDETQFSYSLDTIANNYLGFGKNEEALLAYIRETFNPAKSKEKSYIWRCPPSIVAPYAMSDAQDPIFILDKQLIELENQNLLGVWQLETELLPILAQMHMHGVRVDVAAAEALQHEWDARIEELQEQSMGLNARSGKQIAAMLDEMGIEYPRHPPTPKMKEKGILIGNPKLDSDVLEELAEQVPVLAVLRDIKKFSHFNSTFIKGYIINSHINGRVHATFNQLKGDEYGTVSGRTSTSHPNLANIPNPDNDPYFSAKCRGIFLPEPGHQWLRFDLSQMEYREIVHYATKVPGSGVDFAVKMYREQPDTDFHQMCADMMGIARKPAKNINFGLCLAENSMILTDQGEVPIQDITLEHKLWDGVEWVTHEGVIFTGEKEVITYDGVTATPGHIVFLADGREISIGEAASDLLHRPRLAVAAMSGRPIKVSFTSQASRGKEESIASMQILRKRMLVRNQYVASWSWQRMQLWCSKKSLSFQRSSDKLLGRAMGLHQQTMQSSNQSSVSRLWGTRDKTLIYPRRICHLLQIALGLSSDKRKEASNRSRKQRWTLRSWKHTLRHIHRKLAQYTTLCSHHFSRCDLCNYGVSYGSSSATVSRNENMEWDVNQTCSTGKLDQQPAINLSSGKSFQRVFDIINAGPRNRFTCNGKLVHNSFGMGKDKLTRSLGVDPAEGKRLLELYHDKVPFVKKLSDACATKAAVRGYMITLSGRRRRFPLWEPMKFSREKVAAIRDRDEALARWGNIKRAGTHKALNAITQGTNGDWIKKAMVDGVKAGVTNVLGMYLNTVYDELGLSISTGDPRHEEAAAEMKHIFANAYQLEVPVLVSEGRGANWSEAS